MEDVFDIAIANDVKKRKMGTQKDQTPKYSAKTQRVFDVFGDLPSLGDDDTSTSMLSEFYEGADISRGQFAAELRRLSRLQKERGIVENEGEVLLPPGFFTQRDDLRKAIDAIGNAYVKADAEAQSLTSILEDKIEELSE